MSRLASTLALAVIALALVGCGKADPVARLLDHQEAVLSTLDKHLGSPDDAAAALEAYLQEHGEELEAVKEAGRAFVKEHPQDAQAAMIESARRIKAITERYAKILADHPALVKSDRFTKAYEAIFN